MEPGTEITRFITKQGKEVIVTTLQESDLPDLLTYANNLIAEDTLVLLSGKPLTKKYEKKYVDDAITAMREKKKMHFIARIDGTLAASFEVRILPLRKSHAGEIGISLAPSYRDSGIGKKCMEILISEAKKAGLRLLILTCFAINTRAIHVYKSFGFQEAGRIPGMFYYKGAYEDEVMMYLPLI
ncbi:MAG: GNAT family N-acetyltransferase [Candidatus Gottesmanbacteria bacterium]